jgi:hypothetical protein
MTFEELLDQAMAMLQRRGRVTYRMLKLQFNLDDDRLEALKDELLYAHPHLVNDDGRGLVWTGDARPAPSPATTPPAQDQPQASPQAQPTQISPRQPSHTLPKLSAASSRCCFATWWTPPCSPASSTPRSGVR